MSNRYQKSAVQEYNNTAILIDPTTVGGVQVSFGNTCTKTGCSIIPQLNGVKIQNSGLYEFTFDASYLNGATPGTIKMQLYKDGVPAPCAFASDGLVADEVGNLTFSTRLCVNSCCALQPNFTIVITGTGTTALTLQHVSFGVTRLA